MLPAGKFSSRRGRCVLRLARILIIFVVCSLLGIAPSLGSVLCIGDQGHVAVELLAECGLAGQSNTVFDSSKGTSSCQNCIEEDGPYTCNDTAISPAFLSPRTQTKCLDYRHPLCVTLPVGLLSKARLPDVSSQTSLVFTQTCVTPSHQLLLSISSVVIRV